MLKTNSSVKSTIVCNRTETGWEKRRTFGNKIRKSGIVPFETCLSHTKCFVKHVSRRYKMAHCDSAVNSIAFSYSSTGNNQLLTPIHLGRLLKNTYTPTV